MSRLPYPSKQRGYSDVLRKRTCSSCQFNIDGKCKYYAEPDKQGKCIVKNFRGGSNERDSKNET